MWILLQWGGSLGSSRRPAFTTTPAFQYADPVADLLDRWGVFRARLFRESCVFHRGNYVKDLSRLGRELSKVIIVDNSPASYIFHPENAVSSPGGEHGAGPSSFAFVLSSICTSSLGLALVKPQLCHLAVA